MKLAASNEMYDDCGLDITTQRESWCCYTPQLQFKRNHSQSGRHATINCFSVEPSPLYVYSECTACLGAASALADSRPLSETGASCVGHDYCIHRHSLPQLLGATLSNG